MKKHLLIKLLALFVVLITSINTAWATESIWEWKLYYYNGSSNQWLGDDNNTGDLDFGVVDDGWWWKGAWAKTADSGSDGVHVYYVEPDGSEGNFGLTYQNCWDNCWNKFWKNESGCNLQLTSSSFYKNNPGVNTIQFYVQIDGVNKLTPKATYTIPGFTDLSTTSVTFNNTTVGSNSSKSITYTHYGTAPTNIAARYSITGTDADQFSITALSGTGATIRFSPTSAGTKTATLVINDVHGKQTSSISLSGKTQYVVSYQHGDNATGSTITDYKVYGSNLTLRSSGFTRTGYNLTAWNTNSNGSSGTNYDLGATYKTEAALTLYPTWTAKTTTVTLNVNGATSGSNQTVTATYDAAMPDEDNSSDAINQPSRTGYTFGGYYDTSASSGGTQYYTNADPPASARTWNKDASSSTLYARWTANTYTLTLKQHNGGSDGSATATYDATISVTPPAKTGYTFTGYYTAATDGTQIIDADGHFVASVTNYTNSSRQWRRTSGETLHAQWTANTYDVILDVNGATTGSNQTVVATFDGGMPTTQKTSGADITAPSKTGYTFGGYYANTNGTGTHYYTNALASNHVWDVAADNTHIYAKWTANGYTVTLDLDEANKGTIAGATTSQSVTYDGATTTVPNRPTGADGYALDGYYTNQNGAGTKVINGDGTWIASVAGYTDGSKHWVHDGDVTLYAYYKQAEITALVLTPSTQAPNGSVTATPTLSPTPDGNIKLCWKILRANGNLLTEDGFTPGEGNSVSFNAPGASGAYKVVCILRTGSTCGAGTRLDSVAADLTVAGEHTVTILYQDGDGRTLASSTEMTGKPLEWSNAISPATITGYTFARWDAGDGISITDDNGTTTKTTTTTASIKVKASYEGTLTAVYNKRRMIYFNNTLDWEHVYVYFYSDATAWDDSNNGQGTGSQRGSGAATDKKYDGDTKPYSAGQHGEMQNIAGTNIWYFDMATAGYADCANITFTKDNQHGYEYFSNTEVARVTGAPYNSTTLPMYVPIKGVTEEHNRLANGNKAVYYTKGYWMNYPNNTGYWLKIFDKQSGTPAPVVVQDIPFEFTGDMTMPMSVTAELDAGVTYGFKIYRSDATWYGNTGTMKNGSSGDTGETVWEFTTGASSNCGLKTSIAGDYIFTLDYAPKSGTYYYLVGVHYPVAVNDYRIVYNDRVDWSQGTAHNASWYHPSRAIHKKDGAEDIVSFYVKKDANTSMKFQYASSVSNEGVVTWANVDGGSIDLSDIEESGVYNFYLTQADGAISVSKIEPYIGNYYIRTDCAGSTKWDNYRAKDHQMTYTEFSKSRTTNEFGDLYTHYYMHWCPRETNVKFVIANDYSMCISDTLVQDVGNPYSNINASGYLLSQKGEGKTEEQDRYSANIRFMYNESTNKISRAYMSSSTEAARKFLVLRSNSEFTNSNGTAMSGTGESSDGTNNIYEAIFQDNEDWIYEREVKVTPGSKFKLYACYAQASASENGAQYFRGAYASNNWSTSTNYVTLIGGEGAACKARIVYDFKTNRLMSAYVPEDGDISGTLDINADIMIVREHQEAGKQLTFATAESKLTDVKTVYGVMRFNRWILNNRQHPEDHNKAHSAAGVINTYHPLITDPAEMKSSSERGLYWISFPFDVRLSEVFGFGTYGTDWVFLGYNGAERAKEGYWVDSESFWEYIWDRKDTVLQAGHGIVLALDLDRMGATNTSFWNNEIQQVELFFPSISSTTGTITKTDAEVTLASHECTIDRRTDEEKAAQEANPATHDTNKDRTVVDSHWNLLGVPSYANYSGTLKHLYKDEENVDRDSVIVWNDEPETDDLPFLYEWNANDNTYTVQSGNTYAFKAMHAYYVQFAGKIKWTLASATPLSIVARRTYAERPQRVEFKLELQQNNKMIDQTFVKLSDDEEVSANFVFGEDLSKSLNKNKANVYTIVDGYLPVAGNTMPMSEETMLIPVGVKPAADGEYTFSMPEGTDGIGVILIDNITGTRTNLGLTDYTVNLTAGKINDRFLLEISPISQVHTDVEAVQGNNEQGTTVRKLMIDGILYIVKDGQVFDARGNRVQ